MFVFWYRQYTAVRTGSIEKHVRCEKCGGDFTYEVVRPSVGTAQSPFGVRNKGARAEAINEAGLQPTKKLKAAVDPVPCPKCGWFQEHMVKELRRRDLRWMLWTGWVVATLAWASAVMGLLASTKTFSEPLKADQGLQIFALVAGGAVWALTVVGGRKLLGKRINPNGQLAGSNPIAMGWPSQEIRATKGFAFDQALAQDASGKAAPRANEPRLQGIDAVGWMTIQLANFRCPQQCCSCMRETHDHKTYSCGELATLSVPLCRRCARRLMWKHGWTQIKSAAVGLGLALAAVALMPPTAPGTASLIYGACGLAGLLIGAMAGVPIANRVARPVAFSGFHSELNTVRLKFLNSEYLRLFHQAGLR